MSTPDRQTLDKQLVQRPLIGRMAIVVLVLGLPVAVATYVEGHVLEAAALAVLTGLLPAWAIWWLHDRRIVVGPHSVLVQRGTRVVREFRYDDLTEVRPAYDGSAGGATLELLNRSVVLVGTTTAGKRRGLKVTELTVTSIDPLLRALVPVLAERPELLHRPGYRDVFDEWVSQR